MSTTPRTDALESKLPYSDEVSEALDFARLLEQETTQLRAALAHVYVCQLDMSDCEECRNVATLLHKAP